MKKSSEFADSLLYSQVFPKESENMTNDECDDVNENKNSPLFPSNEVQGELIVHNNEKSFVKRTKIVTKSTDRVRKCRARKRALEIAAKQQLMAIGFSTCDIKSDNKCRVSQENFQQNTENSEADVSEYKNSLSNEYLNRRTLSSDSEQVSNNQRSTFIHEQNSSLLSGNSSSSVVQGQSITQNCVQPLIKRTNFFKKSTDRVRKCRARKKAVEIAANQQLLAVGSSTCDIKNDDNCRVSQKYFEQNTKKIEAEVSQYKNLISHQYLNHQGTHNYTSGQVCNNHRSSFVYEQNSSLLSGNSCSSTLQGRSAIKNNIKPFRKKTKIVNKSTDRVRKFRARKRALEIAAKLQLMATGSICDLTNDDKCRFSQEYFPKNCEAGVIEYKKSILYEYLNNRRTLSSDSEQVSNNHRSPVFHDQSSTLISGNSLSSAVLGKSFEQNTAKPPRKKAKVGRTSTEYARKCRERKKALEITAKKQQVAIGTFSSCALTYDHDCKVNLESFQQNTKNSEADRTKYQNFRPFEYLNHQRTRSFNSEQGSNNYRSTVVYEQNSSLLSGNSSPSAEQGESIFQNNVKPLRKRTKIVKNSTDRVRKCRARKRALEIAAKQQLMAVGSSFDLIHDHDCRGGQESFQQNTKNSEADVSEYKNSLSNEYLNRRTVSSDSEQVSNNQRSTFVHEQNSSLLSGNSSPSAEQGESIIQNNLKPLRKKTKHFQKSTDRVRKCRARKRALEIAAKQQLMAIRSSTCDLTHVDKCRVSQEYFQKNSKNSEAYVSEYENYILYKYLNHQKTLSSDSEKVRNNYRSIVFHDQSSTLISGNSYLSAVKGKFFGQNNKKTLRKKTKVGSSTERVRKCRARRKDLEFAAKLQLMEIGSSTCDLTYDTEHRNTEDFRSIPTKIINAANYTDDESFIERIFTKPVDFEKDESSVSRRAKIGITKAEDEVLLINFAFKNEIDRITTEDHGPLLNSVIKKELDLEKVQSPSITASERTKMKAMRLYETNYFKEFVCKQEPAWEEELESLVPTTSTSVSTANYSGWANKDESPSGIRTVLSVPTKIESIKPSSENSENPDVDESEKLGAAWAREYRELPNQQKIFVKKAFAKIFFEARLGVLKRNPARINCDCSIQS